MNRWVWVDRWMSVSLSEGVIAIMVVIVNASVIAATLQLWL